MTLTQASLNNPDEPNHQLYKHYDQSGDLLYIGISLSAINRLYQHKAKSHWYHNIARVEIVNFSSRGELVRAESRLIKSLKPRHNIKCADRPNLTTNAADQTIYDGQVIKIRDGNGMFLKIAPKGKCFRFDYRFNGKRKTLAIGDYPQISIDQARERVNKAKLLIAEGIDPHKEVKRLKRIAKNTPKTTLHKARALAIINRISRN